jgi:hypothetical protein
LHDGVAWNLPESLEPFTDARRADGAFRMKFFWIAVAVMIFVIVDRDYVDGRGADELFSIVRRLGLSISQWSDDLLRPLRR